MVAALGLALGALALPAAASAQTCGGGGYAVYTPTGYTAYTGFAAYPGGFTSGAVPSNYSTTPYGGCGVNSYSYLPYSYTANTYNPYSGYATAGAGTYGYNAAVTAGYYGAPASTTPSYTGYDPNAAYGTGYAYSGGSAPSYGTPSYSAYGTSPSYGATSSYGYAGGSTGYGTTPSWYSSYTGFAGYPGSLTSGYGSAAPAGYSYGTTGYAGYNYGTTGYTGYSSGAYSGYGATSAPSSPVPTSMLTWGR